MQHLSETLEQVQRRARELARSGTFAGWRAVAFELRFEPGYGQAVRWIKSPAAQDEIDRLCLKARARPPSSARDPRAA